MNSKLTCSQVSALLSYYIEDKLNDELKQFVCAHLQVCPNCRAKYDALKDMMESLEVIRENLSKFESVTAVNKEQDWEQNLKISSYIDNELNDEENLRVKRNIISNPVSREKFEKMNTIRKLMKEAFNRTKNEEKFDYTKEIMSQLDLREEIYNDFTFARIVTIFAILIALCTISAVIIFSV